jgi:hypothetical protein
MFATTVVRSLLCVAVTLIAFASLTPSASADPVNWAENAQFNKPPTTDGKGQLQVVAVPGTLTPSVKNLPNGFNFTDARLEYTIAADDRGKKVTVSYAILRGFNGAPAGQYITQSILRGTLNLPNIQGAQVQSLTLQTEFVLVGAASAAIAKAGPFPFNGGAFPFADNAIKKFNSNGGGDSLLQTFSVVFDFTNVPANAAFGGKIIIDLPGSAESLTDAVPEPATMILLSTGLVGVAIKTRQRRKGV